MIISSYISVFKGEHMIILSYISVFKGNLMSGSYESGINSIFLVVGGPSCLSKLMIISSIISFVKGEPVSRGKSSSIAGSKELLLSGLRREDAGLYTCIASNDVGDGQSNAVTVRVDCEWEWGVVEGGEG